MNIEYKEPALMLYKRRIGAYGLENQKLMEQFKEIIAEENLLDKESVILGIAQDNPELTNSEACRYDICIINSELDPYEGSLTRGKFSGGHYATFEIDHTPEAIQDAWATAFSCLQDYDVDTFRPPVECYTPELLEKHRCELWIPILIKHSR